jgi:Redoxin
VFVGVNISDERGSATEFLDRYGWTWPSLFDPDAELAGSLGLYGQPAVAVLDENGEVVARHLGGGDAETWEALTGEL